MLFYYPRSGGGKAARFHVAGEARRRGIEPIELRQGDDLEELVRDAVFGGADALAMAGGDGSQAIVAMVAAELWVFHTRASPPGPETTLRWTSASIATTSWAR